MDNHFGEASGLFKDDGHNHTKRGQFQAERGFPQAEEDNSEPGDSLRRPKDGSFRSINGPLNSASSGQLGPDRNLSSQMGGRRASQVDRRPTETLSD